MQPKPGMGKGKENESSTISCFKEGGVQEVTSELSRCEGEPPDGKKGSRPHSDECENEERK